MRRFLGLVVLGVVCFAGQAMAQDQVVFVDAQELFKQYYKYDVMQDQVQQQRGDYEMELAELNQELLDLQGEIEGLRADARDASLTDEQRQAKRNLLEEKLVNLQEKRIELDEFKQLRESQIQQQASRMSQAIYGDIRSAVVEYARVNSCGAVIDSSTVGRNGFNSVLYVSPKIDITAEVLEVLNEGRTAK